MRSNFKIGLIRGLPSALVLFLLALPFRLTPTREADFDVGSQPADAIIEGINETSSGLASGYATPDGRALLWKNRDRSGNAQVEFHYVSDGRIPFIAVTDVNDTARYYSGLNFEGFAVENTDNHNLIDHGPHNDGITMRKALATCRTVDDFEALLDSADRYDASGRYGYDYGVIDAYGGASIFETYRVGFRRFDAAAAPDGFLVRTNFSYTGDVDTSTNRSFFGVHRHNRAMALFKDAVDRGGMTVDFLLTVLIRDLTSEDLNPYPLPFQGYYSNYPYGVISNATSICRSSTCAVTVVQGVRDGERPDDAILWAIVGSPVTGVASPLWVRAGSIPPEFDGINSSRLNDRIIQIYNWAYELVGNLDTWKLMTPDHKGLWDYILPLQRNIIRKTEQFRSSPRFDYNRLAAFQNEMAQQLYDSLMSWKPTYKVTEVVGEVFWDSHVTLKWGRIAPPEEIRQNPVGYNIYRSNEPFRDGFAGDFIGTTSDTLFIDESPPAEGAFYQVEARY